MKMKLKKKKDLLFLSMDSNSMSFKMHQLEERLLHDQRQKSTWMALKSKFALIFSYS